MKQRKKTENKIINLLKKRYPSNVNEIIRETKKDPTAVIGAIKRLVKEEILIQHKHKNQKLVAFPTPRNRYYFNRLKKEEGAKRRSQAQIDILVEKAAGKKFKKLKETYKKSRERIDRIDREEVLVREMGKIDKQMRMVLSVDMDEWVELHGKREKLFEEYINLTDF